MSNRTQKSEWIARHRGALASARALVLVERAGLNGPKDTELRRVLRRAGASLLCARNRVLAHALRGTPGEALAPHLRGGVDVLVLDARWHAALGRALAYADREFAMPISKARSLCGGLSGARNPRQRARAVPTLAFPAAWIEGRLYDRDGVRALARLPPRESILAEIAALLVYPGAAVAAALEHPAALVAGALVSPRGRDAE